jgi:hypothetical protein
MRFLLSGMLLLVLSSAQASVLVCRGAITEEWGYLSILTAEGYECIITKRVGMDRVLNVCGKKRCQVFGIVDGREGSLQYVEGVLATMVDPVQWSEPLQLSGPRDEETDAD